MKNRGFSLIELIVVVAIMAVALAVGGYALSAISLANAKNCATEIKSSLEKTRTQACSSDNDTNTAQMMLYRDASTGKVCIEKNFEGAAKEIGGKTVTAKYRLKGTTQYVDIPSQANALVFGFNRSTGGFSGTNLVEEIQISSGGRTYTLTCYSLTGKIKME